jgi:hypothetical protein
LEPHLYSFNSDGKDGVAIPELDALLAIIDRACKRFGVSFTFVGSDAGVETLIVPWRDTLINELRPSLDWHEEAASKVEWVAAAKERHLAARADREQREAAEREQQRDDAILRQAEAIRARRAATN